MSLVATVEGSPALQLLVWAAISLNLLLTTYFLFRMILLVNETWTSMRTEVRRLRSSMPLPDGDADRPFIWGEE